MIIKRINKTKTIAAALTPVLLHIQIILLFVFHIILWKTPNYVSTNAKNNQKILFFISKFVIIIYVCMLSIQMKGRTDVKKTLLTLGVFALAFALVGCGQTPQLKDGKEIVVTVKGKKFTAEDLYKKLKASGGETILLNMVDEYIVNKEIPEDEDAETYAESQIESYKTQYKNYGQEWEKALEQSGYESEEALKKALMVEKKKETVTENYVKEQVTDSEIEKYYEDEIFGDIEAKHILISPDVTDDMESEEKTEAENKAKEKAEKIIKKLNKGANFEELAKENSDDKGTASKGGKLTVTYGDVVDEFWEATNKLKDKTYTKEPVKTEYGYHIIYRESQKEKPKLKAVRDEIIDKIVNKKIEDDKNLSEKAIIELRKKYDIKITDKTIKEQYSKTVKNAEAEK